MFPSVTPPGQPFHLAESLQRATSLHPGSFLLTELLLPHLWGWQLSLGLGEEAQVAGRPEEQPSEESLAQSRGSGRVGC